MPNYRKLRVWRASHRLVKRLYRETGHLPREETYGLRNQILRAAVSVAANIAEGSRRGSDADFARFLRMALGSASELEYHLLLARELGFLPASTGLSLEQMDADVMRMLQGLITKLSST